jgi:predicted ester cyclase
MLTQTPASGIPGFDPEFQDLDHYIRVITDRIWEQGRTLDILRYYSDPCVVETPLSVTTSVQDVVDGTRATQLQFPDRRLLAEDIIISGEPVHGFLSSHRICSPMTHSGIGVFGPPTGRKVHALTIADCVCKNNRVVHEWLVRDQAAIALQIGTTPQDLAQKWLAARPGWRKPKAGPPPEGYVSHLSSSPWAQRHALGIESFLRRQPNDVSPYYDDAIHQTSPGNAVQRGHTEVASFWHIYASAFEVKEFHLEHLAAMADQAVSGRPQRLAMRFRALCVHQSGAENTRFGPPTGKPVELLGIVHAEFVQGRVLREWVLMDEVAIWMQILRT